MNYAATRSVRRPSECTKIVGGWRLRPRPHWGSLQRSPRPPSWIQGVLLLRLLLLRGRERRGGEGGEERGRKGRGGEGRGGQGMGGQGRAGFASS